ncbi:Spore germination protein B1 [Sporomusa silvacetica DSM 10669]|uniref:Spore germination protein B1 n=2 Tax=Sporomusa silvacetica TaxID=55504 RepID=A0ABZ3IU99_9FIRM|nr:spore germination protein B1 [Sporomusa silvacetica DSM 10669]
MLFTYEILREAGIRMPKMIGPAVSIVGALVLGQSAVEAGLVSTLW